MRRLLLLLLVALGIVAAIPLLAQDRMSPEEQKDWLVQFAEGQLSTPERQIRISNIDGALSQQASIREITIADQQGVWLRVRNAAIDWDQGALFTGRLLVRSLTAESIEYLRNAVPSGDPNLPPPEAGTLALPEFPIAIQLDELAVPRVSFGESVFGLGSEISLEGSFRLEGGSLAAALAITRLDGPGGRLDLAVDYRKAEAAIDVDVTLVEPEDGILANLLNIEGRPELALAIAGSGPVSDLQTTMTLDAGGRRALEGAATITQAAAGLSIEADLGGPVGELVAAPYRAFFGETSSVTATALLHSEGGLELTAFRLAGGQLRIDAAGATTADGFLSQLAVDATIADQSGAPVLLPVPGAATTIKGAQLAIDFGGESGDDWTADMVAQGLVTGSFEASELTVSASGIAERLEDPTARRLTFNADGVASGITSADPDFQAALGDSLGFGTAGLWTAGQPVQLAEFRLVGEALSLVLRGVVDDFVFAGDLSLETSSVAPFSGVAGRALEGALKLDAAGTISPVTGGFDLRFDGLATDLQLAAPQLDPLLLGEVRLTGRLARTEQGLEAEDFRLGNSRVQLAADGRIATGRADFTFSAAVDDLALVSEAAGGRLEVAGSASGEGEIALELSLRVPNGAVAGRTLSRAVAGFSGSLTEEGVIRGALSGDAMLDGHLVSLSGDVHSNAQIRRLSDLRFAAGPTVLSGDIAQDSAGLFTGGLELASSDIGMAGALLLVEARGSANATIRLAVADGRQRAEVSGSVAGFSAAGLVIGTAEIDAVVADLFGVPLVDGTVSGRALSLAGVELERLEARASRRGETTAFNLDAALAGAAQVTASGELSPLAAGYRLQFDSATLQRGALEARLAQPAVLAIDGDRVSLDAVRFDVGSGSITATGTAGQALDIGFELASVPLGIANAVAPDLQLSGVLSGSGRIRGSAASPRASFTLAASGIGAAALESYAIAPLQVSASGSYSGQVVSLDSLTAAGAGGLRLSGSGRLPLAGDGLAVALEGTAPLALAAPLVASRGGQLSGTAALAARIGGTLQRPLLSGRVSTSGAGYVGPETNLRLTGITGSASLEGERVVIDNLSADLATGGSLSASGSVGLGDGNPADVRLRLASARYADGNLLVATVSGELTLSGRLARNPLLGGSLLVERADITVPESFGSAAALVATQHVNTPAPVLATLRRATIDASGAPLPQSRPSILQLDVEVAAPNQIFVRGRGLDAEVAGTVRLTGSLADVRPVGGFTLIRGRLALLGQRVAIEEGSVSLVGDLDPFLQFVARSEGSGITAFVTISGRVSDLEIGFSSNPSLPEDEVLSRLLFNRSMGELSPRQLARLAGAAAELAGGSNPSLVDSLRDRAGFDDLDIVTGEDGNVAVQAGRYIQDNIYLGVQAGADGNSRVTVDLDLTDDIKARAATGTNGDTSVGVFYETDY